jgi:hypothetical protein
MVCASPAICLLMHYRTTVHAFRVLETKCKLADSRDCEMCLVLMKRREGIQSWRLDIRVLSTSETRRHGKQPSYEKDIPDVAIVTVW